MKWLGIMFMAVLLASAPGYGSAQQPKDAPPATQPQYPEVKGAPAKTAKSFTPEEKQAYEKKTAKELDAIQQKIVDLRVSATGGAVQKKRRLMVAAKKLQMLKIAAENRINRLEKSPRNGLGPAERTIWIRPWWI